MLLWWKLVGVLRGIPTKLILGALVVLAVVVSLWLWRNSILDSAEQARILKQHEAYRATQEAIDEALDAIRGFSPDAAREWLRSFSTR